MLTFLKSLDSIWNHHESHSTNSVPAGDPNRRRGLHLPVGRDPGPGLRRRASHHPPLRRPDGRPVRDVGVADPRHPPRAGRARRGRRPRRRFIPARVGNTPPVSPSTKRHTVHPRSRGEHERPLFLRRSQTGSSPLARGTQHLVRVLPRPFRFIPARAGNTGYSAPMPIRPPVHPRSRGEHLLAHPGLVHGHGSSPLARGTPDAREDGAAHDRFIPARAGNTLGQGNVVSHFTVHPRSRGEHSQTEAQIETRTGSSPLARGTLDKVSGNTKAIRFIPARAGNTRPRKERASRAPVHPRSRGEHAFDVLSGNGRTGSSPLARGTRLLPPADRRAPRFIPARAGNTRRTTGRRTYTAVHPRSRGEHQRVLRRGEGGAGSSPLARGTHHRGPALPERRRFIPARAGNTGTQSRTLPGGSVHPRSRGEHVP